MFGGSNATDKALLKLVTQKLSRGTGSSSRMTAMVQNGTVTINGKLQYDAQRSPLLKLVARIPGVRRVVDQLTLIPKTVYPTGPQPPRPTAASEVEAAPVAADEAVLEPPALEATP